MSSVHDIGRTARRIENTLFKLLGNNSFNLPKPPRRPLEPLTNSRERGLQARHYSGPYVVEAAADVCMNTIEGPRRAGDVGCLIADASKLRAKTGWTPKYNDLSLIVKTALAWEKKMLES